MSWTPAAVPTALWLDASDASSLTLSGSNVDQWRDKSGNAKHANAITAAPTYDATGLNGQPALVFTPNQFLDLVSVASTESMTVLMVINRPDTSSRVIPLASASGIAALYWDTPGAFYTYLPDIGAHSFTQSVSGDFLVSVQRDASNVTAYRGGSIVGSPIAAAANSGNFDRIGTWSGIFTTGAVAEVVVFANDATTDTRQRAEGYAAHKWGLTASLPVDHPYKSSPPAPPPPEAIASAPSPLMPPSVLGDVEILARLSVPSPLGTPAMYLGYEREAAIISVTSPLGNPAAYLIKDFTNLHPGAPVVYYRAEVLNNVGFDFTSVQVPISSWQATLQVGERSSYLQCVVPAADPYIDQLTHLAGDSFPEPARLRVIQGFRYPNGAIEEAEFGRVQLQEMPFQKGQNRSTVTLGGYGKLGFRQAGFRDIVLSGIQTLSVHGGVRVRCEVDWRLRPGMTAIADGVEFEVSYINLYANENQQFMEVGERPL